jgi:DNA-binding GntR family transcriptional regulator
VRVARLDARGVMEVTEMRAALEPLALGHALGRMTPDDLAEAASALAEGEASRDLLVWDAANRRFHLALLRPCALPRLLRAVEELHHASSRVLIATWRERDWQGRSDQEHQDLLAAVAAGRGEAACTLLRRHITAAGAALAAGLG